MTSPGAATLVDLLGDTRAQLVGLLRRGERSVGDVAAALGLAEAGVRRHLQLLERDGIVASRTVRRPGRGRPGAVYTLTDRGLRLFPDASADLAVELMDFLEEQHGRSGLLGFLRWRQARQEARYAAALSSADGAEERATALAGALSEDGFLAEVVPDGTGSLALTQHHCAIGPVAESHPELCAYEAAMFRRLLGTKVVRRQTIAAGAPACVCHVTPATERSA